MQTLNAMAATNPALNDTLSQINNEYGGNAEAAFYARAKQLGADPNQVTSLMRQFGFR